MPDCAAAEKTSIVIADDISMSADLESGLIGIGCSVCGKALTVEKALKLTETCRPDLVMMNVGLQGEINGIAAARIMGDKWGVPVVFLAGPEDGHLLEQADFTYPFGYLIRPFNILDLKTTINMTLKANEADIGKRWEKEALLKRERRLIEILKNIPGLVYQFVLHPDGKISIPFISEKVFEFTGNRPEEIMADPKLFFTPLDPQYIDQIQDAIAKSAQKMDAFLFEQGLTKPDGSAAWIQVKSIPHKLDNGDILWDGILLDISDQKSAEGSLLYKQKLYKTILQTVIDGFWLCDIDGRILEVNEAYCRMSGYSEHEVLSLDIEDLDHVFSHQEIHGIIEKVIIHGHDHFETRHRRKDGSVYDVEVIVQYIPDEGGNLFIFLRDISERVKTERINKKLQSQLHQSQKMEAIGTMAGGIAHDFNNILTVILGYAQMARAKSPEGSRIKAQMDSLFNAGKRATDLVQQILAFSRSSDRTQSAVDFYQVITEALKLIRSLIPSSIELRNELQEIKAFVMADPTELHQIILNLSINAYHAIGDEAGVLSIGSQLVNINQMDAFHNGLLTPGEYILLSVKDTGAGIEQAIINKIFDPYFTTKSMGEGTGLGLSVVHGIVSSYGGAIRVYSEKGVGTTFKIYLPTIASREEEAEITDNSAAPQGSETILLVDDEELLLVMIEEMLLDLGYNVDVFSDSRKALAAFQNEPQKYDLVITDQTMPHLTGLNLAEKIKTVRMDIPIILSTGFSSAITPEKMEQLGIRECLMKPILFEKISQTVRHVLDEPAES